LAGFWLAFDWLLTGQGWLRLAKAGFWLAFGWLLAGFWLAFGWPRLDDARSWSFFACTRKKVINRSSSQRG
jgi:hypothetical protein